MSKSRGSDFTNVVVVLMAGGAGTRFWPLSTPDRPKQFLEEFTGRSLFAQAADRARKLVPLDRILVSTSEDLAPYVRRQAPQILRRNVLVEPLRRDTAAALIYAAAVVEHRWPGSVMIATPSDHFIDDPAEFRRTMAAAVARARRGGLGTVGIRPAWAATEFGYLRLAAPPRPAKAQGIERFVEKPNLRTARRYLDSGRYLWNSGIFVWQAAALLEAARQHLPETWRALEALTRSMGRPAFARDALRTFRRLKPISIDYAIMEKTADVWCVPGAFEWNDVGNWLAVQPLIAADARGNRTRGDVFLDETRGAIVVAERGRPIIVAGLRDCIVVQTAAGTLVCHKSFSRRLKPVINRVLDEARRRRK